MSAIRAVSCMLIFAWLVVACSRPPAISESSRPTAPPSAAHMPSSAAGSVAARPPDAPRPYVLEDTEVHDVPAPELQRDYQIFVSLPAGYAQRTDHRYPVLFVTDANYAFPLIRSIARRVGDHGRGLEDFILVGLSYAVGDTPEYSRRRDYTPTPNGPRNLTSDMPGRPVLHGGAEAYRRYLAERVIPFVAARYRIDPARRIYAGHSYGALLGAHMLLTAPEMFDAYILSSPSLWYGSRAIFAREEEYARTHPDLRAEVFFVIASYETINPDSNDPRYSRDDDMIGDLREFRRRLGSRGYAGLKIAYDLVDDEDHLTVYPASITRGLHWALPPVTSAADRTVGVP